MGNKFFISKIWLRLSVLNAILVTITSLLGIFNSTTYSQETRNWATQAMGQDIANLVVVPVLLCCTYLLAKGSSKAYLVWLGAHFYLIYAFVIYAFAVRFNFLFLVYITIFSLSIYVPVGSLITGAASLFSKSFTSKIDIRPSSILLLIIGVMFSSLWLGEIIPHLFSGTKPQSLTETGLLTNPVHVLDLGLLLPAMIITSIMLWKRKFLGYFLAVPLLVFSATMGIGIITLFILLAAKEGSIIAPPAFIIGLIVILSTYFSYRFLNNMNNRHSKQ